MLKSVRFIFGQPLHSTPRLQSKDPMDVDVLSTKNSTTTVASADWDKLLADIHISPTPPTLGGTPPILANSSKDNHLNLIMPMCPCPL